MDFELLENISMYSNSTMVESDSSEDEESEQILRFPLYVRVSATLVCCLVLTVGVLGNLLVPLVIWKNRDLRNSTNMFLLNLSMADLCVLVLCMPKALVEVHTRPEVWVLGEIVCHMIPFMELVVAHVSVLTMLSISAERYYAICVPLRVGYLWTQWRAMCTIAAVWLVAIATACPLFWIVEYITVDYMDNTKVPVCATMANSPLPIAYFVAKDVIFFLVPMVVLLLLYTTITRHLMRHPFVDKMAMCAMRSNSGQQRSESAQHRSRKQVVFMLIAVVVCFFVCMLPSCCFRQFIIFASEETIMALGWEAYHNINFACRIMVYVNCAMNPILYNMMSTKFRCAFRRVLRGGHMDDSTSRCGRSVYGHSVQTASSRWSSRTHREFKSISPCYSRQTTPLGGCSSGYGRAGVRHSSPASSWSTDPHLRSPNVTIKLDPLPTIVTMPQRTPLRSDSIVKTQISLVGKRKYCRSQST